VKLTDLRKVFPGRRGRPDLVAVDGVSFTVPQGSSLAIVGESGSGKTTTARIIAGLETATAGSLELDGQQQPVGTLSRRERRQRARHVQMVFQDPNSSLDPTQTAGDTLVEIVRHHTGISRRSAQDRARELMDQVGLHERLIGAYPRQLSGGQQQRVAIARALAGTSRLLILDEAVSALDVSVQAQVLRLLQQLRAERKLTYVFVSHDLGVVRQISDRCVVMYAGRIVEAGPTQDVLDHPEHEYTRRLISAVPGPDWVPRRHASLNAASP
jgi:ABC-type oligopeptide transport system ATPase subunit